LPRPNPPRPLRGEANLARRVAFERQRAGMSTDGLAKRMTDLGCPIHQSAIWKIENGDPPRRITYDEALAFAEVFGLPLEELAIPPELVTEQAVVELIDTYRKARDEHEMAYHRIAMHIRDHPETRELFERHALWEDLSTDPVGALWDRPSHRSAPGDWRRVVGNLLDYQVIEGEEEFRRELDLPDEGPGGRQ
jgi:transcriptional regulator with XRE-family HTH domain